MVAGSSSSASHSRDFSSLRFGSKLQFNSLDVESVIHLGSERLNHFVAADDSKV